MITISIVILIVLIVAFIGIGIWFRKTAATTEGFLLAGRGAPFWLMASAYLGGYVGGASVSGYVGMGYAGGISAMWASLFGVTGCVAFTIFFARRLNYFGHKTGAVTITDFICARYGESLRLPAAIVAFLRPSLLTGMQFLAVAVVANIFFGLSIQIGVVIAAVVILLYLVTAGQYSALITQWFQAVFQSLGIILFVFAVYKVVGNPTEVTARMYDLLEPVKVNFWSVNFSVFTTWLLTFCVFLLCDPWIYMWAFVGKTPKVSSNAMLAVLCGSYYNVLPFIAGLCMAVGMVLGTLVVPAGYAGDKLYAWFTVNFMSTGVGVLVLVGLLMTVISCGSSFAMNGVTILTRDIYQKVINKKSTDKQSLLASRLSLLVVVIIGIAGALWLPILVPLWSLALALVISGLLVTILSAWFWKRSTTAGAMASTVLGGLSAIAWAMYAWKTTGNPGAILPFAGVGLHAAHVGVAVSIPAMIIGSLVTKADYSKAKATSYKELGKEMLTSSLVQDKQTEPGLFGWLGAKNAAWKIFWIVELGLFVVHYILSFFFHVPAIGLVLVWVSIIVGVLMIFMTAFLGGKDIISMVKVGKELRQDSK